MPRSYVLERRERPFLHLQCKVLYFVLSMRRLMVVFKKLNNKFYRINS
jgi:hypothetical protein